MNLKSNKVETLIMWKIYLVLETVFIVWSYKQQVLGNAINECQCQWHYDMPTLF